MYVPVVNALDSISVDTMMATTAEMPGHSLPLAICDKNRCSGSRNYN